MSFADVSAGRNGNVVADNDVSVKRCVAQTNITETRPSPTIHASKCAQDVPRVA